MSAPAYISYSRNDAVFASRLAHDLKAAGAQVWLDQDEFQPGDSWAKEIEAVISAAPFLILVLSPASCASHAVKGEVNLALAIGKTIIPVLYKDCQAPLQISKFQSIDFRTNYEVALANLLHVPAMASNHRAPDKSTNHFPPSNAESTSSRPRESSTDASAEQAVREPLPFDAYIGSDPYIFVSYSHKDSHLIFPEIKTLHEAGFRIWYDEGIASGSEWPEFIANALNAATVFLVFISKSAAGSRNVRNEINFALNHEKPFLAVHLEDTSLPAGLELRISDIQAIFKWQMPNDYYQRKLSGSLPNSVRRVELLSSRVSNESLFLPRKPEALLVKTNRAESSGLASAGDSTVYVERPADHLLRRLMEGTGKTALLIGASQMGKTSMLGRALEHATEIGKKVVLLDLQMFDSSTFESLGTLYKALAAEITDQLGLDSHLYDTWNDKMPSNMNFDGYMRKVVMPAIESDLVLAIDETDRLLNHPFYADVFSLFRAWDGRRAIDRLWRNLSLVILTSTEPYFYISTAHQSPFNIGEHIRLRDFNRPEIEKLNELYGSPIQSAEEMDKFYELFAGHPFLSNQGLAELAKPTSLDRLLELAPTDEGPFCSHLRGLLATITSEPQLVEIVRNILERNQAQSLDEKRLYKLRASGILQDRKDDFRCELYRRYISSHLVTPAL